MRNAPTPDPPFAMNFATAATADLLEILCTCELDVPPGLAEELVCRREETVDPLCEILLDEADKSWAPIHALHLLGAMGDVRSVPALAEVIRRDSDLDGALLSDWLTEVVPGILARLPGEAYDTFEPLVRDPELGTFHRLIVAEGLFAIAIGHPEHRQRLVDLCLQLIPVDDDISLTTSLIDLLARVGHPDAGDLYDRQTQAGRIDAFSLSRRDLDWIADHYSPWTEPRFDRAPLTHFTPERLEYLRGIQDSLDSEDEEEHGAYDDEFFDPGWLEPRRVIKIGRNDPCPCGSGKKYKKCCLGTDRDPARSH